jgi:hypothetical protein
MNPSTGIEREPATALALFHAPDRPRTRQGCGGQTRPCPWAGCKYHLALDVNPATGSIHLNAGARGSRTLQRRDRLGVEEWLERAADAVLDRPETCALDVAERGGATLEEVAELLGITRERARQIEVEALAKLRQLAAGEGDDGHQAE